MDGMQQSDRCTHLSFGGSFSSKTKVLNCVFSCSDVGSKWRLLCSLLHPTTEHLKRLGAVLVYTCSGVETSVDCVQLTQGGPVIKHQCQSIVMGCQAMSLCPESVNGLIWKSTYDLWGFLQSTLWILFIIGCLCTHTAYTHFSSNMSKWI